MANASLSDILQLVPVAFEYGGVELRINRPTVVDLIEVAPINADDPARARLWCLARHLRAKDGAPLFVGIAEAERCPAALAAKAIPIIEGMYNEGLD